MARRARRLGSLEVTLLIAAAYLVTSGEASKAIALVDRLAASVIDQVTPASIPPAGHTRALPFPDGMFSAVLCSRGFDHLPIVGDAEQALRELHRVTAGPVYVVSPHRWSLAAWAHTEHALWVDQVPDGSIRLEQR